MGVCPAATNRLHTAGKHRLAASGTGVFLGGTCRALDQIGLYRFSRSFSRSADIAASKKKERKKTWKFLNHSWTLTGRRWKINVEAKNNEGFLKLLAADQSDGEDAGRFFLLVPKGLTWIFSPNNSDARMTDCNINTCEDQGPWKASKKANVRTLEHWMMRQRFIFTSKRPWSRGGRKPAKLLQHFPQIRG